MKKNFEKKATPKKKEKQGKGLKKTAKQKTASKC